MSLYDPFALIYDDWSGHMTEDVAFYVELARETDGPLVELAVGNGRVAIPVARETGRPVLGIDASAAMLAQARQRTEAAGVALELRQVVPRHRQARMAAHQVPREGARARDVAREGASHHVLQQRVLRDQALGIVRDRVRAGRRRTTRQVAERAQVLARGRVGRARSGARIGRAQRQERRAQPLELLAVPRGEVALLARVAPQVVQLGHRQLDELHAVADDAEERCPAAVERARQRLEVGGDGGRLERAGRHGHEAAPGETGGRRQRERVEHGGQDVHVARRGAHGPRQNTPISSRMLSRPRPMTMAA